MQYASYSMTDREGQQDKELGLDVSKTRLCILAIVGSKLPNSLSLSLWLMATPNCGVIMRIKRGDTHKNTAQDFPSSQGL